MWVFKVLWIILKWTLILGVPILGIIRVCIFCEEWKDHNKPWGQETLKSTTMSFENFVKLYPISSERWYFNPYAEKKCSFLGKEIEGVGQQLFFKDNTEIPRWSIGYEAFTQIYFKSKLDFLKYQRWLEHRTTMIKNNKVIENQKESIENMDAILKVIQGDIDKVKEEADEKIAHSLKETYRIYNNIKQEEL